MNKYKVFFIAVFSLMSLTFVHKVPFLENYVNNWGIYLAEKEYGSAYISHDQEMKIYGIADELGIDRSTIEIRKTNQKYLQAFGYYNAFFISPALLRVFPVGNKRFIYVSEGFINDLSKSEYRFLIGHELIHAKYRHMRVLELFLAFLRCFVIISLMSLYYFFRRRFLWSNRKSLVLCVFAYLILVVPIYLGGLAYRRHVEWVADKESIAALKTSGGCIEFMDRLTSKFGMSEVNYNDYLADHPSPRDRKNYCLKIQNSGK